LEKPGVLSSPEATGTGVLRTADELGGLEKNEPVAASPRRKRVLFVPLRPAAKPPQTAQSPGFG
jgi:hypothetical protein